MQCLEDRETAGLKLCHVCAGELRRNADNYCRRCGARQNFDTAQLCAQQDSPYKPPVRISTEITALRPASPFDPYRRPVR
jgi:predicted amidophosphoribosyltransferase